jgi:hypothetical protein
MTFNIFRDVNKIFPHLTSSINLPLDTGWWYRCFLQVLLSFFANPLLFTILQSFYNSTPYSDVPNTSYNEVYASKSSHSHTDMKITYCKTLDLHYWIVFIIVFVWWGERLSIKGLKITWKISLKISFRFYNILTHWGRGNLNCLNARSRGF